MDDFYSVEKFRKAGANANITKDSHVTQIIEEIKQQYQVANVSRTSQPITATAARAAAPP